MAGVELVRFDVLVAPEFLSGLSSMSLDDIIPPSRLGSLPALPDSDLERVIDRLVLLEREISARRRSLHEVLDRLQEEIVRRYSSGEASVDNLLS